MDSQHGGDIAGREINDMPRRDDHLIFNRSHGTHDDNNIDTRGVQRHPRDGQLLITRVQIELIWLFSRCQYYRYGGGFGNGGDRALGLLIASWNAARVATPEYRSATTAMKASPSLLRMKSRRISKW
jgi:hypothetical protein